MASLEAGLGLDLSSPIQPLSPPVEWRLLQPFERQAIHEPEFLLSCASDAEAQVAALWSRLQVLEGEVDGSASRSAPSLDQPRIAAALRHTLAQAAEALGPSRTSLHLVAGGGAQLRLILAAGRAETLLQSLRDPAWAVCSRHLKLLEQRGAEPLSSFAAELNRLAEQMATLVGEREDALREQRMVEAYALGDRLALAEAHFIARFEEAVAHVAQNAGRESSKLVISRIQLLLLGHIARRRLRLWSVERAFGRLEALCSPPRTWPFDGIMPAEPSAAAVLVALAARIEGLDEHEDPNGREHARQHGHEDRHADADERRSEQGHDHHYACDSSCGLEHGSGRDCGPCPSPRREPRRAVSAGNGLAGAVGRPHPRESTARRRALAALDALDRVVAQRSVDLPRVEWLRARLRSHPLSSLDARDAQTLAAISEPCARRLARGEVPPVASVAEGVRMTLFVAVLEAVADHGRAASSQDAGVRGLGRVLSLEESSPFDLAPVVGSRRF